ncbi:uncharacterized protein LOC142570560 [Dermacentor variabilis]|uniref:uncharacterized protein LOC142570560 n=1 Tax=Dermacentor variabilis TaxID=34621 RepID=UPI003F5BC117
MSLRHVKKRCSVVHCDSVDSTIGVTLHRFPLDFHRCRAWAQFCRNVSLEKKAPSQLRELRICSRHFEPSVYLPHLKRMQQRRGLFTISERNFGISAPGWRTR